MDVAVGNLPDTQCTQSNEGVCYSQEVVENNCWARLYALKKTFGSIDLVKNEYAIGRAVHLCDVVITRNQVNEEVLGTISKLHFKIKRETMGSGTAVYLDDFSFNGTFINGEKVGKGKRRVLQNNDEISLSGPQYKVFAFLNSDSNDPYNYPEGVRSKYTVGHRLGRGACGEVYLVFEKNTCKRFAMKVVIKRKLSSGGKRLVGDPAKVMNEVNILKALQHPCIINIHDIIDTDEYLYMVLELMEGGELFERITSQKQLAEAEAKLYFYQIVLAVQYLHSQGITHRDLKPENILLSSDSRETLVKVSDFGLSKFVNSEMIMTTFCGTPLYVAPEVLETKGRGSYTMQVDVWSLGVILYACLSGCLPFDDNKDMPLAEQIKKGRYSFPYKYWQGVTRDAIDLIIKMLTVNPKKRITINEITNHPWLLDDDMKKKTDSLIKANYNKNWPDENTDPTIHITGQPSSKRPRLE